MPPGFSYLRRPGQQLIPPTFPDDGSDVPELYPQPLTPTGADTPPPPAPVVPSPVAAAPPPPVEIPTSMSDEVATAPPVGPPPVKIAQRPPAVSLKDRLLGRPGVTPPPVAVATNGAQQLPQAPTPRTPGILQRIGAMALGAGAGYVNAAGRSHIDPQTIAAGKEGILHPGYGAKQGAYNRTVQQIQEQADLNAKAAKEKTEIENAASLKEQREGMRDYRLKSADTAAAALTEKTNAATAKQAEDLYAKQIKGRSVFRPQPGESAPPGWNPIKAPDGVTEYASPAIMKVPKELVEFIPGSKEGDQIDSARFDAASKVYQETLKATKVQDNKPDAAARENENQWIADSVDPKLTPAQRSAAASKLKEWQRLHPRAAGMDSGAPSVNVPPRNPTLGESQRDQGVIASRPAGEQAVIKQLVDYKLPLPTGIALSKPYWQNMIQLATQYDPSFDVSQYSNRQKLRNSFMSGQDSQAISALNTVNHHIARLETNWKALNNSGGLATPLNAPANAAESFFGDKRLNKFQLDQEAVSNELMRVWRQVGASEAEIKNWAAKLSPNLSPQAQQGAIEELYELVHGKIIGLKQKYETGMGRPADFQMLTPEMKKAFATHGVSAEDLSPGATYQESRNQPGPGPIDATITMKLKDGRTGEIHASQMQNFIRDNPGAQQVK